MSLSQQELLKRLNDDEDHFIERKSEGVNSAELRKTLVAFANSAPRMSSAVLFIGIQDDGHIVGVRDTDGLQKRIQDAAKQECYPEIECTSVVLNNACGPNGPVVAVLVPYSNNKPHFAGNSFVRKGSQSTKASLREFEALIASRNEVAGKILTEMERGKPITVQFQPPMSESSDKNDFHIRACDAHSVELFDTATMRHFSFPLKQVQICRDVAKDRFQLIVQTLSEKARSERLTSIKALMKAFAKFNFKYYGDIPFQIEELEPVLREHSQVLPANLLSRLSEIMPLCVRRNEDYFPYLILLRELVEMLISVLSEERARLQSF